MARFLNAKKAVSEIEDLIREADSALILISPYLKLSKRFQELLDFRSKQGKAITIIYGKKELQPQEDEFLKSLRHLTLKFRESLHAKCYASESKMIITSLNLHDFSMINNDEMGVLLDLKDPNDIKVFEDATHEIEIINRYSEQMHPAATVENPVTRNTISLNYGFCIRTGTQIPFDIEKPLSIDAYRIWNEYGDLDYPENYCHFSGEKSNGETSFGNPVMRKNWKKAKMKFNL